MNRIIFVVSKVRILDQIWSGFGQESRNFEQKVSGHPVNELIWTLYFIGLFIFQDLESLLYFPT